jgi:hypothetical protein
MPRRPEKPQTLPREPAEQIQDFLARNLPPGRTAEAAYLTEALLAAGARYDRYIAAKAEWWSYVKRKERLERVARYADWLEVALHELDIISRDDFAKRVDRKEIDALIGLLRSLGQEMAALGKQVQSIGKPRDLAEERWVMALADIYENVFGAPACIGPLKRRGNFYALLLVSRPTEYPGAGKLSVRQINRMLERKRKKQRGEDPPTPPSRTPSPLGNLKALLQV